MDRSADVVVIGGGVNGTSIAMHLATMGAGRVLVVERGHLAAGGSGRSGAMVREHYQHPALVRMAMEASEVFHNFGDVVGGDARFVETGRLLLFAERDAETVRANVAMNRGLGVVVSALTPPEIAEIIPQACIDDVALAVYEPNSGHADPVATTYAYAERARTHGASVLTGCEVTGIRVAGGRVVGVEMQEGLIETDAVVVATGPWVNGLAAPLGELLPVTPVRVQMVHMRRPPALESLTIAVADGLTGGYIRAGEGFNTLVGGEGAGDFSEVSDPDDFSATADHETIARFWSRARLRFPDFAAATPLGGYAALYDMTPDGNPVLDASGVVGGLYWAVGFSGHGFKLSPVVGRMVAELVLHGESSRHPISPFRMGRFADGEHMEAEHPYEGWMHP